MGGRADDAHECESCREAAERCGQLQAQVEFLRAQVAALNRSAEGVPGLLQSTLERLAALEKRAHDRDAWENMLTGGGGEPYGRRRTDRRLNAVPGTA